MPLQSGDLPSVCGLPNFNEAIRSGRGNKRAAGIIHNAIDFPLMTAQAVCLPDVFQRVLKRTHQLIPQIDWDINLIDLPSSFDAGKQRA